MRMGIDLWQADEASVRLLAEDHYPAQHLPRLLELCREVRREREAAQGHAHAPGSREAALAASAGCLDCSAGGLTLRHRHKSATPEDNRIVLYCLCPYGRWVERTHAAKSPDIRRRIYDLADHPLLQLGEVPWSSLPDNRYRYPAHRWDAEREQPIPWVYRRPDVAVGSVPAEPDPGLEMVQRWIDSADPILRREAEWRMGHHRDEPGKAPGVPVAAFAGAGTSVEPSRVPEGPGEDSVPF